MSNVKHRPTPIAVYLDEVIRAMDDGLDALKADRLNPLSSGARIESEIKKWRPTELIAAAWRACKGQKASAALKELVGAHRELIESYVSAWQDGHHQAWDKLAKATDRVSDASFYLASLDGSQKNCTRRTNTPTRPTDRQKEIADAVVTHHGNRTRAAHSLGISRQEVSQQLEVYVDKMEKQDPAIAKQFKESIRRPKKPRTQRYASDQDGQEFVPRTDRRRKAKSIRRD